MDINTIISLIAGSLILICIIIAIIIRFKSKPSKSDKEAMNKFLEGLSETFYENMLNIINNINFEDYSSLVELEVAVLSDIYDSIWEYVESHLKESAKNNILSSLALKVLNKEFVDTFVDQLIKDKNIEAKIEAKWNKYTESKNEDVDSESNFSNMEYYTGELSNSELRPAKKEEIPEEVLSKLNPQSDEEETLNPEEDDSIEIVDESIVEDSNDRKHDKSTGRFI